MVADSATYGKSTLHGYAKTPSMILADIDIGPVKPGLEVYVETLGIFIIFLAAQANETMKRPLMNHETYLNQHLPSSYFRWE